MGESGPPDLQALKEQLRTTWTAGDYAEIARGLEPGAMAFVERIGIEPGAELLDVACGAGQVAIPAARAGARVTGLDLAPNWIEQARERARAEGLEIRFDVGDAEDLPYEDAAFDLTVSLIGAMFAPQPERVVAELLRVTRPGGRIVMGNWTSESFVGDFFRAVAGHVPPPDMPSPLLWGDEDTVRERFREGVSELTLARQPYDFRIPLGPDGVVAHYGEHFGPVKQALACLDEDGRAALARDLVAVWMKHNRASDGSTHVRGEILDVTAVRA